MNVPSILYLYLMSSQAETKLSLRFTFSVTPIITEDQNNNNNKKEVLAPIPNPHVALFKKEKFLTHCHTDRLCF